MPELRIDPATGRQVLLAEDRVRRPQTAVEPATLPAVAAADCPFCLGREDQTPPAVAEVAGENGSWQVRVVPNLYPAIVPPAGRHEVVIESPDHLTEASLLGPAAWQSTLLVYRDRLRVHLAAAGVDYAAVFKNSGAAAGASLEHVHSQILSLPTTPVAVVQQLEYAAAAYQRDGRCLYCALVDAEIHSGERLVLAGEHVGAFTAFAGRQPYETWILPRRHAARFDELDAAMAEELAAALHDVLERLARVAPGVAYNLVLCTAPADRRWDAAFHWHWQLIPRMARAAGLEIGSGVYINTLAPEEAAKRLRTAGNS